MEKSTTSKEMAEKIKNEIRSLLVKNGQSLDSIAKLITAKGVRSESLQNLSQKLNRGSIKYAEVIEIAELLGYEINWDKVKDN